MDLHGFATCVTVTIIIWLLIFLVVYSVIMYLKHKYNIEIEIMKEGDDGQEDKKE